LHVIARKTLVGFWTSHPDAKEGLQAWFQEAKAAGWKNSAELKSQHGTASIVNSERAVFNICGNTYRLIVRINYGSGTVFIRFIGTHVEYDRIDAETV
jgi:mRNA interferase HigB